MARKSSCAHKVTRPPTRQAQGTLDIAVHGRMCGAVSLVPTCVREGVNRGYLTMHVVREMNICVNDLGCVQATIFARPENCWHATRGLSFFSSSASRLGFCAQTVSMQGEAPWLPKSYGRHAWWLAASRSESRDYGGERHASRDPFQGRTSCHRASARICIPTYNHASSRKGI